MALRPSKILDFDDPEDPRILEDFIEALGAEPVKYPWRNECCGAYVALDDREAAARQADRAILSAASAGAGELVTACPLCRYNLTKNAAKGRMPVRYFTQLLAEALGVGEEKA
jgi:heterodisulfide reductase subunit B